jgi:small subunit ribosomal protein S19
MARSLWKGPFVDGHLISKVQKLIDSGKTEID